MSLESHVPDRIIFEDAITAAIDDPFELDLFDGFGLATCEGCGADSLSALCPACEQDRYDAAEAARLEDLETIDRAARWDRLAEAA